MEKKVTKALIGLSSYAYRWASGFGEFQPKDSMTSEILVKKASEYHLGAVQICDNIPFIKYAKDRLRAVKSMANDNNVAIETGSRGGDFDTLSRALDASIELGSKLLRLVVEIERTDPHAIPKQLDALARVIEKLADRAIVDGIRIAVENHSTLTASELISLIERVNRGNCGVCIDTMNSVLLMENPLQTVRYLAPHALTVHLKDFRVVKHPDRFVIEGTPLGNGILSLPSIINIIETYDKVESYHIELYIERRENENETLKWERIAVESSVNVLKEVFKK